MPSPTKGPEAAFERMQYGEPTGLKDYSKKQIEMLGSPDGTPHSRHLFTLTPRAREDPDVCFWAGGVSFRQVWLHCSYPPVNVA